MFDRWFRLAERFVEATEKNAEASDRHSRRYVHADTRVEGWRKEEMAIRQSEHDATLRSASSLNEFLGRHGAEHANMIDAIAELRTKLAAIVGKSEPR
jgi:hypothetical protein